MNRSPLRRGPLGARGLVLLLGLVLAATAILYFARRSPPPPTARPIRGVLHAVPEGALAVVVVDLPGLRASPLGATLLDEGRKAAGFAEMVRSCGGDPLDGVAELALALSPEGVDAGFGVFASGALDAERLLRCAEELLLERGGKPVRVQEGSFAVLRDGGAHRSPAELALRDGGPLLLSERPYLREALATVAGERRSLADDPAHAALRERIGAGAIVATSVLGPAQRQSLRQVLRRRPELEGLSSAALRVELRETVDLYALVLCDRPGTCPGLARELEATVRELGQSPTARLLDAAPLLARVQVRGEPDAVRIEARVPLEELLALQRRLETLAALAGAMEEEEPSTDAGAPDAGKSN